jgi:hypothetical protein
MGIGSLLFVPAVFKCDSILTSIQLGETYYSKSGVPFKVLSFPKHGQDCSHPMVLYKNLTVSSDGYEPCEWVISRTIFKRRFYIQKPLMLKR